MKHQHVPTTYLKMISSLSTFLLMCLLLSPATIEAQANSTKVNFSLNERETVLGAPVFIRIDIDRSATSIKLPGIPQRALMEMKVVQRPSMGRIGMNGRVQWRDVSYVIAVTFEAEGQYEIPSFQILVDGQAYTSPTYKVRVKPMPQREEFQLRVTSSAEKAYVGTSTPVTLEIKIKAFFVKQLRQYVDSGSMWALIDWNQVRLGPFSEALGSRKYRPTRERRVELPDANGVKHLYYIYEIDGYMYPKQAGESPLPQVKMVINYPELITLESRGTSLRREPVIRDSIRLVAFNPSDTLKVQPIPEEGRPVDYNGAVGRFRVHAEAINEPVSVGDPITLEFYVSNDGPPPALHLNEAITRDFKVSADPPAGMKAYGAKVYDYKLVPRHENVKEIPAIPYSSFQPATGTFRTVMTQPIPIEVRPAVQMDLSALINQRQQTEAVPLALNERWGMKMGVITLGYQALGDRMLALVLAMLMLVMTVLAFAVGFFVNRTAPNEAKRRKQLERELLRRIQSEENPEQLSQAILTYGRLKLNLPEGAGRRDILEMMNALNLSEEQVQSVSQAMEECQSRSYMPMSQQSTGNMKDQVLKAVEVLKQLSAPGHVKGVSA